MSINFADDALVAELVDAADLKSVVRKDVPVRFRPSAPFKMLENQALNFKGRCNYARSFNFLNIAKTSTYTFLLVKFGAGEQND